MAQKLVNQLKSDTVKQKPNETLAISIVHIFTHTHTQTRRDREEER